VNVCDILEGIGFRHKTTRYI